MKTTWIIPLMLLTLAAGPDLVAQEEETKPSEQEVLLTAEALFQSSTLKHERQAAAYFLVQQEQNTSEHLDYLIQWAEAAADHEAPFPVILSPEDEGEAQVSPQFESWAAVHDLDVEREVWAYFFGRPGDMLYLARAENVAALPTLRKGLESANVFVAARAAEGLARLGDSPDAIVAAAERASGEDRALIAEALLRFPQELYQQRAEELIADPELVAGLRDALAREGATETSEEAP